MQSRQSIPTIFNIYMVDVLCCALGCVVFLWLINVNEARNQTDEAEARAAESDTWRNRYEKSKSDIGSMQLTLDEKKRKIGSMQYALDEKEQEIDSLLKKLLAMTQNFDNAKQLATLNKTAHDQAKAQAKVSMDKLLLQIAAAQFDLTQLKSTLDDKQKQIVVAKAEKDKWKSKYTLTELLVKRLEMDLKSETKQKKAVVASSEELQKRLKDVFANLLSERKTSKEIKVKLALSEKQIANLNAVLKIKEKNLKETTLNYDDLVRVLNSLNTKLKTASTKINKLEFDAKNRFAGVELTGERVLFLIDVSRSMKMSTPDMDDKDKWPQVCDTVGKIMGSLPDLKLFQVIKFSEETEYLFPELGKGKWLKYEENKSVLQTVKRLKQIDPVGGTNTHDAFEEAFRFRNLGLDTIYVISDGVPSRGPEPKLRPGEDKLPLAHVLSMRVLEQLRTVWNQPQWGKKRVRINTVGFFFDNPQVGAFLWALARENDGSFVGLSR